MAKPKKSLFEDAPKESASSPDERCCHGSNGSERCKVRGWLSHNTMGGPWFCRDHFWDKGVKASVDSAVGRECMAKIKELIARKTGFQREPGQEG